MPSRLPTAVDIQVVGGGILGASAALALAEAGHEVTLRERGQLGAGNTAKAAGVLSTMTWHDLEYRLIAETRGLIGEAIALAAGMEPAARGAWRPLESIVVARGDGVALLDDMQDRLERFSEEPERMGHRQAGEEFRGVRFAPGEEVLVAQEDGVIDASALMAALRVRLDAEGVTVSERDAPDLAAAVADEVPTVVAAGAWTKPLLAAVGVPLPVQMFRTQMASLAIADAASLPILHDGVHHFYARPESEGSLWAGDGTVLSPHDADDYNEAADPAFRDSIARRVVARFAAGAEAAYRTGWAGLCVATPDRHPLCGPVSDHDALWVLTGDNGFGLMRGLALGERLAEAVAGRVDPLLDPGRFPEGSDVFRMQEGYGLPA